MMGYFSNLAIDIEEALHKGATVEQIAKRFNMTILQVQEFVEQLDQCDRDPVELGWPKKSISCIIQQIIKE